MSPRGGRTAYSVADFKSAFPFGNNTFANASAAVQDLFAYKASKIKAEGLLAEAGGYTKAALLARANIPLEAAATKIKQVQTEREALRTIGAQQAGAAGAGFEASGSALDLLRNSQQQGALAQQLIGEQGAIQENAYEQQAQSYDTMAQAAQYAASATSEAGKGTEIAGIVQGATAVASVAALFL